jgi:hypothetical protein
MDDSGVDTRRGPNHEPFGHFTLRGRGDFQRRHDTRRARSHELRDAQAGEYRELEDSHPNWALDHRGLRVVNERTTDLLTAKSLKDVPSWMSPRSRGGAPI